jgi:alkaline phosphatase
VAGAPVSTVAYELQRAGRAIGVVTSVTVSHATPASAYAHNVDRDDYQDLSRDLLGLPSISHPETPLPGVDVLIGGGYGLNAREAKGQGSNFVAGNQYLTDADRQVIDAGQGGRYVVAERTAGVRGADLLLAAAQRAGDEGRRLFGFFGVSAYGGHLPFRTADGGYDPTRGKSAAETYTPADIEENPTLAEMTTAALTVLSRDPDGFWLMVEAGDVDWANHDVNLDNSIGAVLSGDAAVKVITDWVEAHSNWDESLLIVTSDHGHDLNLLQPEALTGAPVENKE